MARIAGRNGRVYVALTSGGTAEPIPFINKFSMSFTSERIEVSAFGDTNRTYVQGLPDSQGDFSGYYDDSTDGLLAAAQDGLARKFYWYPTTTDTATYWYGTAFFDFSMDQEFNGAATVSGTWAAASAVTKV